MLEQKGVDVLCALLGGGSQAKEHAKTLMSLYGNEKTDAPFCQMLRALSVVPSNKTPTNRILCLVSDHHHHHPNQHLQPQFLLDRPDVRLVTERIDMAQISERYLAAHADRTLQAITNGHMLYWALQTGLVNVRREPSLGSSGAVLPLANLVVVDDGARDTVCLTNNSMRSLVRALWPFVIFEWRDVDRSPSSDNHRALRMQLLREYLAMVAQRMSVLGLSLPQPQQSVVPPPQQQQQQQQQQSTVVQCDMRRERPTPYEPLSDDCESITEDDDGEEKTEVFAAREQHHQSPWHCDYDYVLNSTRSTLTRQWYLV